MQLSADEISSIIKKQIQNFDNRAQVSESGTVLTTGDGIARIHGLEGVMPIRFLDEEASAAK